MRTPLPAGFRPLLLADTQRAEQWRRALERRGAQVQLVETRGEDADRGAWQICVREADLRDAQVLVTAVTRGETRLPSTFTIPPAARMALIGFGLIAVVVGAMIVIASR